MDLLYTLGARHWVNHNLKAAEKLHVSDDDFAEDNERFIAFLNQTGLDKVALRARGQEVVRIGYRKNSTQTSKLVGVNVGQVQVYTACEESWGTIDGRMPQSDLDNRSRYTTGVQQGINTCAVDATLCAAIRLDVGRVQIDQLPLRSISRLEEVPRMFRRIVSQEWGTLKGSIRARQRDLLAEGLAQYPQLNMRQGMFLAISDVVNVCFRGLPQLSYTTIDAQVRCNDQPYPLRSALELGHMHHFSIMSRGRTVQDQLTTALAARPGSPSDRADQACFSGCTCVPRRVLMIVDRLPPILMVVMPEPITESQAKTYQPFENLKLRHWDSRGYCRAQYEAVGCIMHALKEHHFVTRWRAERERETIGRFVQFDGMQSEKATSVSSWYGSSGLHDGPGRRLGVEVMFYRMIPS